MTPDSPSHHGSFMETKKLGYRSICPWLISEQVLAQHFDPNPILAEKIKSPFGREDPNHY